MGVGAIGCMDANPFFLDSDSPSQAENPVKSAAKI